MQKRTFKRIWQRSREILNEEGPRTFFFKLLGETVYRRVVVVERLLREPVPSIIPSLSVRVEQLERSAADEWERFRPEYDSRTIIQRLRDGERCFIARLHGSIIHSTWITSGCMHIDYLDRDTVLAQDEAYIFESYTAPSFRGHGIGSAVWSSIVKSCQEAGFRKVTAVVIPENKKGFGPPSSLNFQAKGLMGYYRIGTYRKHFIKRWADTKHKKPPETFNSSYWNTVLSKNRKKSSIGYPFLNRRKYDAYSKLLQEWCKDPIPGRMLKTDLYEETVGGNSYLFDLSADSDKTFGMDISTLAVETTKRRVPSRAVHAIVTDVRTLPFHDHSFSLILSPSTLDHFSTYAEFRHSLRELVRVLISGGVLLITLDNRQNVTDFMLRLGSRLHILPYPLGRSYRIDELCAELEAAGLTVKNRTAIVHNPRLLAVGLMMLTDAIRWKRFTDCIHRALIALEKMQNTSWRFYTGSFIAVRAVKEPVSNPKE
jgi:ribosomal protein S18 acetylase RimI-like enzyme